MDEARQKDSVCLAAYGAVGAMVSHDLKNTLAIINENAGLLDDLALLAGEEGVPPGRVQAAAKSISHQVARSTRIIGNLNKFAHSGDRETERSEIDEIVRLMAELTSRRAAMRGIAVEVLCDPGHQVELGLVYLEVLCYRLFVALYDIVEEGTTIVVTSVRGESGLTVRFAGKISELKTDADLVGPEELVLLQALEGRCQLAGDAVLLLLPSV